MSEKSVVDSYRRLLEMQADSARHWRETRRKWEAQMPPMPAYSGPTDCPKCASTAVGTRLCQKWDSGCREAEHIHRDCARCGHGWLEAPLDAKEKTNG
jgi:hypothetical protein